MEHVFWIVVSLMCVLAVNGQYVYWTDRIAPPTVRGRIFLMGTGTVIAVLVRVLGEYALN